jgi:hypothetical protein
MIAVLPWRVNRAGAELFVYNPSYPEEIPFILSMC